MIKKLRLKMIAITMGVLILVFAIVFITLNVFMQTSSTRQTEHLLEMVAEQDGMEFPLDEPMPPTEDTFVQPGSPDPEMMRAGRFFYVKVDDNGNTLETNSERMFDVSQTEAEALTKQVLASKKERGSIDNLQYLARAKDYGQIIVFAEDSIQSRMLSQLIQISLLVAGSTFVIILGFSFFLSRWAVHPVAEAFDKQRRFVSDAGHELKTPLTIISANVDVLENEIGENTRLTQVREQSQRMNALIQDLLSLAKTDEGQAAKIFTTFDLSGAIKKTTLEFESTAFEAGRHLHEDITPGINYQGHEARIAQLTAILIDNGLKYSNPGGKVDVSLTRSGEKIQLRVANTGPGLPSAEWPKVFDRFYRSDDSRSRETGGYGLGLAIAKAIVDEHKAKIAVTGQEGEWIAFVVTL